MSSGIVPSFFRFKKCKFGGSFPFFFPYLVTIFEEMSFSKPNGQLRGEWFFILLFLHRTPQALFCSFFLVHLGRSVPLSRTPQRFFFFFFD